MARMLWTQREDIGPPPGGMPRMAYDEARKVTTLLHSVNQSSQTWFWDGELWLQVADSGPVDCDSVAWDPVRKLIVACRSDATWEWSGTEWTQVSDQRTGAGRSVFDDRSQLLTRMTQMPGKSSRTWTWSGGAWTEIDDMGPPAREHYELVGDRKRGVVLLVAGVLLVAVPGVPVSYHLTPVRDTWAWNGRWKAVSDMGPSSRATASVAYDRERSRVVLFGGQNAPFSADSFANDTWEWDGALWRQVQDMGPSPRGAAAMAYDTDRKRVVLFGGAQKAGWSSETWEYYDHS